MTIQDLSNFINTASPKALGRIESIIINKYNNLYPLIKNLNTDVPFNQRVYLFINNKSTPHKCACGCSTSFISIQKGYRTYCCAKCSQVYGDSIFKREATCLNKYGTTNPANSLIVQYKKRKTLQERYGVDYISQIPGVLDKKKQTWIKKYGVDNPNKNVIVRAKTEKTNIEKYGGKSPVSSEKVQEKRKQTCLDRYGCVSNLQTIETKEKIKQTCLQRYGVESASKSSIIKQKSIRSNLIRRYKILSNLTDATPLFSVEEYTGVMDYKKYAWCCNICKTKFYADICNKASPICSKCNPKNRKTQQELVSFIQKYTTPIQNYRKAIPNREIDIFIPSKNIGIEFNGNYWHSDKNIIDSNYHLNKSVLCEQNNIRLIQVFEDEWRNKKRIVQQRIKHILGYTSYKLYARCCEVRLIDKALKSKFLTKYHIQGNSASDVDIGLFYKDNLVSVMSFIRGRQSLNTRIDWELIRYANIFSFTIVGAASRLLSFFEKLYKPKEVVSYADRRWSTGNVYKKLGFSLSHVSSPGYWYLDNTYLNRYHRYTFRKNVLKYKIKNYDESLTESENMKNNGYSKIWDCGNYVFVKKYTPVI